MSGTGGGTVIYQGPSQLDGAPIVVVLTRGSENVKTGGMAQTWILRADVDPVEAAQFGRDASVCGDCPLAGKRDGTLSGRACYVTLYQAPTSVYRAWKGGAYGWASEERLPLVGAGLKVRMGAYGDPAAVPMWVWEGLLLRAAGWTGYTHQWAHPRFDRALLDYVMASIESESQVPLLDGARYFRVRSYGTPAAMGEVQCPAAKEARSHGRVQCADCMLCDGGGGRSVSIAAHGNGRYLLA